MPGSARPPHRSPAVHGPFTWSGTSRSQGPARPSPRSSSVIRGPGHKLRATGADVPRASGRTPPSLRASRTKFIPFIRFIRTSCRSYGHPLHACRADAAVPRRPVPRCPVPRRPSAAVRGRPMWDSSRKNAPDAPAPPYDGTGRAAGPAGKAVGPGDGAGYPAGAPSRAGPVVAPRRPDRAAPCSSSCSRRSGHMTTVFSAALPHTPLP